MLTALWHSRSFVPDENCQRSLKLWITDGNYYIDSASPNLKLYCQSVEEVQKSYSLDAFRFSAHAAQTVFELERTSAYPKLTAWRMIQAYYAAFYAAHSILRFFGRSFSHLENGHVQHLSTRSSSELGSSPSLPSSYYLIELSQSDHLLTFSRHSESHKDMWRCFLALSNDISREALSLRATRERKQDFSLIFSRLSDALTNRGRHPAGNWLSLMRNDVTYKSSYGVWFPFEKTTPEFEGLMAKHRDWRKCEGLLDDPNLIRNDNEKFFAAAFLVVDLALSISFDYQNLVKKSGRRSTDFSKLVKLSAAA